MTENKYPNNDLFPLLLVPKQSAPEPKQDSYEVLENIKQQYIDEERFKRAIQFAVDKESRTEWKQLMNNTQCFVRLWLDPETKEECPETSCALRVWCSILYKKVKNIPIDDNHDVILVIPERYKEEQLRIRRNQIIKNQGKKFSQGSTRKIVSQATLDKEFSELKTSAYVDLGRPVDKIVKSIMLFLNDPPILPPEHKRYKLGLKIKTVDVAAKKMVKLFGPGLFVTQHKLHHTFFLKGHYFFRVMTYRATGSWVRFNKSLLKFFTEQGLNVMPVTEKNKRYMLRFTHQFYISSNLDLVRMFHAIANYPGLEYLRQKLTHFSKVKPLNA